MTANETHMLRAIRLAHRALGTTAENPPVGCVIVKENKILGVGWTQAGGRPHAETEALAMAGEAARGATAYVTLEPCAHHGRTPPCAEALVKAGISRVLTALEDPDPRVKGSGHAILRAAGIEVITGICAGQARPDLAGFFSRSERKRPYVILKLAVSADGKIAAGKGERTQITGDRTRARVLLMRAQSDAVLVGLGTVQIDNPSLLSSHLFGILRPSVRIVADSQLAIPRDTTLVRTAIEVPTWILSTIEGDVGPGVEVIVCAAAEGKVDLHDAMAKLGGRGIGRVMAEGGAQLARSLLDADLVDEVALFQAPMAIGEEGVDALAGLPLSVIAERFKLIERETLGSDALTVYGRG